ncbi:peptidase M20 domain-containing protein 2 [Caerostris darwini]|uniref:Peptidase M20 domain-containing protein 2 n=1 Tax=Caerostris darwini TaxID=1538125 RepID=A0AAV4UXN5_9ARAC|nr:peptidase M20 domain-containing protein 2 [Caerostris darwini]
MEERSRTNFPKPTKQVDHLNVLSKLYNEEKKVKSISERIWKDSQRTGLDNHNLLVKELASFGFTVTKHFLKEGNFKAEYSSKTEGGPAIAIVVEYSSMQEYGLNLVCEAGLAASLAIKGAMDSDPELKGKVVVLGFSASQSYDSKANLVKEGVFEGLDAGLMAHPSKFNCAFPSLVSFMEFSVRFKGEQVDAGYVPSPGKNALDAAVLAYQSIALMRPFLSQLESVQAILKDSGIRANVIPGETGMVVHARAANKHDLSLLFDKLTSCIKSAGSATNCEVEICQEESNCCDNFINNKVMGELYKENAKKATLSFPMLPPDANPPMASTDMGIMSHLVPCIHPFFNIFTPNSFKFSDFRIASNRPFAHRGAYLTGEALALTAIKLMRCPETLAQVRERFLQDTGESHQMVV